MHTGAQGSRHGPGSRWWSREKVYRARVEHLRFHDEGRGRLTRASCLNGWKTGTTISCGATGEKFVPVDGRRFVDY